MLEEILISSDIEIRIGAAVTDTKHDYIFENKIRQCTTKDYEINKFTFHLVSDMKISEKILDWSADRLALAIMLPTFFTLLLGIIFF